MRENNRINRKPEKVILATENTGSRKKYVITKDPEFKKMQGEFQQGHWTATRKLLELLENKYPRNKVLSEFRNEFDLRFSIANGLNKNSKEKKKRLLIPLTRSNLIVAAVAIVVLCLGYFGFVLARNYVEQKNLQQREDQINSLSVQVEALLRSGQPEKAQDFVDLMQEIDPENETVIRLSQEVNELKEINDQYLMAVDYMDQGQYEEALPILTKINDTVQNYKDVPQLLETAATQLTISEALAAGKVAYESENWQRAIDNFETILELEPAYSAPTLKDMLLNSYLKRIIQMLESSNASVEEISLAETYYRRAIAMIPQSKIYLSERENLQKASRDLLILKYTQTAYMMIEDPEQTLTSVNEAVDYLQKASNLDSTNPSLQTEVNKIKLYQAGFEYFLELNWPSAIQQLTALTALDKSYAGGFAGQMLYEAHIGRGRQYFNVGFYLDARKEFEAAEGLAMGEENLLKRFTAELEIGRALDKLQEYEDAASYYKYAFASINYEKWSSDFPDLVTDITNAINLFNVGSFRESSILFTSLLAEVPAFYSETEITVHQGTCFAMIAAQYHSSVQEILTVNDLPQMTRVSTDQILKIPTLER